MNKRFEVKERKGCFFTTQLRLCGIPPLFLKIRNRVSIISNGVVFVDSGYFYKEILCHSIEFKEIETASYILFMYMELKRYEGIEAAWCFVETL